MGKNKYDDKMPIQAVMDYKTMGVHKGKYWSVTTTDSTFTAEAEISISFTTPSEKEIHLVVYPASTLSATLTVLERSTVTAGSGSVAAPANHNRDIFSRGGIVSEVKDLAASPASNSVTIGGTITNDGTTLLTDLMGANRKGSTEGANLVNEWLLAKDATYSVRLKRAADVASGIGVLTLAWCEHKPKE